VHDQGLIDETALRALGARGFVRPSDTALQVVLGPHADAVAGEIRMALQGGGLAPLLRNAKPKSPQWREGRLLLTIAATAAVDVDALKRQGVRAVWRRGEHLHLVLDPKKPDLARALAADLALPGPFPSAERQP
jgi:N-acetylglucosamine PTS system EIICBA or EIICB component